MTLLRALLLLLALTMGSAGSAIVAHPFTAATAVEAAQTDEAVAPEDGAVQARAFAEAYNTLLDHYVHPLDVTQLLSAGWDQLTREAATGKAAAPGPAPTLIGDRAADLDTMQAALTAYLKRPDASADGFVAAHALIRGMVRFVDEGHTYFLDPQQYQDYQSWSRGDNTYVGIGISVSAKNGEPRIVEVFDDTPASQAGLQPGDMLVKIAGHEVADLAVDEMTSLVRGPVGSAVELVVRRGSDPTPLTFSVQRMEIHLQFVQEKTVDDNIGYVSLRGFPEPSVIDSVDTDVANFQQAGVKGLVLDLRGNSGGRIDVGTRLLSRFLPGGTTIYEEVDSNGTNHPHFTRAGKTYDLPVVVLVDGGTASMGEIFASAVQEQGAATVLGTATSGSVAAAQVFPLPDGSALQVTVFDILSADGKPLNKVGVVPDEVIDQTPSDDDPGADPVLSRAVEILHDKAASSTAAKSVQQP
jgi:carboxyl-terminal processing protease